MLSIISGILAGIASGLGLGGGTVLILILTFFVNVEQHTAQAINLIFYIPTSIVAIIVNLRNKIVDKKLALTISIYGVVGAIIGAILANKTGVQNLRKYFGIFLVIIAIYEIYSYFKEYIIKNNRDNIKRKGN